MVADQVRLEVESALRQIGFVDRKESIPSSASGGGEESRNDPSGNGEQSVDEGELLRIVQQLLPRLEESSNDARRARMADMAKWKQLLTQLPYHIALDILEYHEQTVYSDHREIVGYFGRDPTRKCHLIFRSLNMSSVPSPNIQENVEHNMMRFIMRNVRHLTIYSMIENLPILDQWMRPPMKTSIESLVINDTYSTIDRVELQSLCPAVFSTCKSLNAATISDKVLKFKNLAHLTLASNFSDANIGVIKQLPAHSLKSLSMTISTHEHIRFLSGALGHLQNLKELYLSQLHEGDVWSDVAVALRNAPRSLRRLTYLQCLWNGDDNMRVKIVPGMFSSTLAKSIDELHLRCRVGNLTGLAEFSRLRSLSVQDFEDAVEVHALYSALRLVPSLTELSLRFTWGGNSFTPALSALTDIVNELPRLQNLRVSIHTLCLIVSDSAMARFLSKIAQSEVKLHWSMHGYTGSVSFSPGMYQSFLTVLLHPELRYLLHNFYRDENLRKSHSELNQAVGYICYSI